MKINDDAEMRGFILTMLKINHPYGCSDQLISVTLNENDFFVSPALLSSHIRYLEEKELVRVEDVKNMKLGISRTMVFITHKGIDLLAGDIPPEPGVLVPSLE